MSVTAKVAPATRRELPHDLGYTHPLGHALNEMRADLLRVALADRWAIALFAIGWLHLAVFGACETLFNWPYRAPWIYVSLWAAEVVLLFIVMRSVAGRGWSRRTPMAGLVLRVWVTFLILTLSLASLNRLFAAELDWFKLGWATLSTFGFAMTAWLLSPWFIVLAVQMSLTGMLMSQSPNHSYIIYGLSWFVALHALGFWLQRQRRAIAD